MFTFKGTIIDSHGITHTDPVFIVQNCNHSLSKNTSSNFNFESGEHKFNKNDDQWVNYSMAFWTSEKARDDEKLPLSFSGADRNSSYHFNPTDPILSDEDLLLACESHFTSEVLPEYEQDN